MWVGWGGMEPANGTSSCVINMASLGSNTYILAGQFCRSGNLYFVLS